MLTVQIAEIAFQTEKAVVNGDVSDDTRRMCARLNNGDTLPYKRAQNVPGTGFYRLVTAYYSPGIWRAPGRMYIDSKHGIFSP